MALAGVDHGVRPDAPDRRLDALVVVAHDPRRRAGKRAEHLLPLDAVRAARDEDPPGPARSATRRVAVDPELVVGRPLARDVPFGLGVVRVNGIGLASSTLASGQRSGGPKASRTIGAKVAR